MPSETSQSVTELLDAWGRGDRAALDAVVPAVYAMLHQQAERALRGQPEGHTLRGGDAQRVTLSAADDAASPEDAMDVVALDEALNRLAAQDERKARVVELRYLVGLSIEETAQALDSSPATVKREWTAARAWLRRELTTA